MTWTWSGFLKQQRRKTLHTVRASAYFQHLTITQNTGKLNYINTLSQHVSTPTTCQPPRPMDSTRNDAVHRSTQIRRSRWHYDQLRHVTHSGNIQHVAHHYASYDTNNTHSTNVIHQCLRVEWINTLALLTKRTKTQVKTTAVEFKVKHNYSVSK